MGVQQLNLFHNTVNITGIELAKCQQRAASQQEMVLELFRSCPSSMLTATKVYNMLCAKGLINEKRTPITSIRRAITNLKNSGALMLTSEKEKGCYDVANCKYMLNKQAA